MGMNGALKAKQILTNAYSVLGIELIAGAQPLDFREFSPGRSVLAAKAAVGGESNTSARTGRFFPTTTR